MFGQRKKVRPGQQRKQCKHPSQACQAHQACQAMPSNASNASTSSNVTSFLSKMLTSPDVMLDPSFFNTDLVGLENLFVQTCFKTCELERKKEKEKKQEAVSAAVEVQIF
jgi:hypothetical protein